MKIETRMDQANVPAGAPNIVHVLLTVTAPDQAQGKPRPQLNIAAVIDRSGSMQGKKLEFAKAAVSQLLDQLGPQDRFSLVAFDDEVLPLVEGVRTNDKTESQEFIARIEAGGSTNLSGGWIKGLELAGRESKVDQLNAVLLLTDGQANVGITDQQQLVDLGEIAHKGKSIRTICLGLGSDFNEDLLKNIATAAGGRFYYIESPDQTPEVFTEELGGLLSVVTQNVELELKVADGVLDVANLTGYKWKNDNQTCRILLGDVHANQVKHVLLAFCLPAMHDLTDMHLAAMRLMYADLRDGMVDIKTRKQALVVHVVNTKGANQLSDPEVLLHIALHQAATARKEAVAQLDKDDIAGATQVLEKKSDQIRNMAPKTSDPARLMSEVEELQRRAAELRETQDVRENRKFMVAEGNSMSICCESQTLAARKRHTRPRPQPDTTA